MNKIILFLIGFFFSFASCYGQCNVVKNGDFTGGIASTWGFQTSTTGWYYNSSYADQAYIQQDNLTTRPSLKQTVNGLLGDALTLSFKVRGQNYNRASGTTRATLEIRLGGTTYATILNPASNTTITSSNITAINGATLFSVANFPINTNTTPLGQGTVTLTIPWSSKPTTADLEFVQTLDTGDDWVLDDIALSAPLPTAYSVTGGGNYCTGGSGVAVGLSSSQSGVSYQLQREGVNTGSTVVGTGSAIIFGNQTVTGNYKVVATNTGSSVCTVTMTGSAMITANALPIAYSVTGSGSYCAGGTGVAVGLSNSQSGVNYQLQIGNVNTGTAIPGTGAAISFGLKTAAGTYTVIATNVTTTCTSAMTGSASVTVNPLPNPPTIGTTTHPSCATPTGSVVLNSLPTSGLWTLYQNGVSIYSGTAGSGSYTVSGLSVTGSPYTFTVANANCTSNASASVPIAGLSTTTWTNGSWDNEPPTFSKLAILASDYDTLTNANIDACSMTINTGVTLTIQDQKFVTIQNDLTVNDKAIVEIKNRGSLVMINNLGKLTTNGSGKFIVNKTTTEFEKYDYTYWSTPLSGTTNIATVFPAWRLDKAYSFHPENFIDKWNYATGINIPDGFDDDENDWLGANSMNPGRGYIIMGPTTGIFPKTESVVFSGKVNTGTVTTPINLTPDTAAADDDFNLVGNPYPCAISADALIKANIIGTGSINTTIDGTLYFWTHKADIASISNGLQSNNFSQDDYAIYTLAGGTGTTASLSGGARPLGYIASGQGFFVEGEATGLLTFNNSMRVSPSIALTPATKDNANSQFYKILPVESKSIDQNRIWLNLENDLGMFSQQLVGYFDNTSLGFDKGYDGLLSDAGNYINFYSFIDNVTCKIQARPTFAEDDEVSLGYFSGVAGTFNINIDSKEGVFENSDTNVFIEDKLTNVIHNLKESPYTFETTKGTFDNRFVLRYTDKTLGVADLDQLEDQVIISKDKNELKIKSATETIQRVTIFDLLGKKVFDKEALDETEFRSSNVSLFKQMGIVKVTLATGQVISKKVAF